jgi:hypothetical protein
VIRLYRPQSLSFRIPFRLTPSACSFLEFSSLRSISQAGSSLQLLVTPFPVLKKEAENKAA